MLSVSHSFVCFKQFLESERRAILRYKDGKNVVVRKNKNIIILSHLVRTPSSGRMKRKVKLRSKIYAATGVLSLAATDKSSHTQWKANDLRDSSQQMGLCMDCSWPHAKMGAMYRLFSIDTTQDKLSGPHRSYSLHLIVNRLNLIYSLSRCSNLKRILSNIIIRWNHVFCLWALHVIGSGCAPCKLSYMSECNLDRPTHTCTVIANIA